ncbi:MAG TPA: L-serine ammonia-lyase [Trinickia sp.]|uniref:L-serine ammonia-lyase n=1 Tax=Trinickia sp. TaxID=2571163 RepID=UPI002F3E617B
MISTFDLFKIGIGPSSSHTVGPMVAAKSFRDELSPDTSRISVELFGSLAWTGFGHGTDSAICLGLLGETPVGVDPDKVVELVRQLKEFKSFIVRGERPVGFDPVQDLKFDYETLLSGHTNGMRFRAFSAAGDLLLERIAYSIGGGFVTIEGESASAPPQEPAKHVFRNGVQLLELCNRTGMRISEIQRVNEEGLRSHDEVRAGLDMVRNAMFDCIDRGLRTEGRLPGNLNVQRRAKALYEKIQISHVEKYKYPHEIMDSVSAYAIAVNEENASGGRVVTAPTNGAAGIVPAVLRYYRDFCNNYSEEGARDFLLTSAAIGGLVKMNASISGAEVGCQGEVGSAAAMAAAGLAAVLGASPYQIENAAEIALEHHLGMTCDPVGGLVQIPCIERNAFGANKAIVAASLALRGDGTHRVSLDEAIETMRQTGLDMLSKYKETSQGGLAVNVANC